MILKLTKWFKRTGEPGQVIEVIHVNHKTGSMSFEPPRWRIVPILAWYDFWVGIFVDREKRKVYFFPIPCVGIVVYWG